MMYPEINGATRTRALWGLLIFLPLASRAIWVSRGDRVLLCEHIAFGSFCVAICLLAFVPGWQAILLFGPMFIFAILAGYFAVANWFCRKRQTG